MMIEYEALDAQYSGIESDLRKYKRNYLEALQKEKERFFLSARSEENYSPAQEENLKEIWENLEREYIDDMEEQISQVQQKINRSRTKNDSIVLFNIIIFGILFIIVLISTIVSNLS